MKIPTFDATGKPNGYVVPIWRLSDPPGVRPDQIYLTAVSPRSQKGPHLHHIRRGSFCCIKGNVRLVTRVDGSYLTASLGEDHNYPVVAVPTGIPACLYNDGDEEALVLNMPSPAWSKDAPDEHEVENWNP